MTVRETLHATRSTAKPTRSTIGSNSNSSAAQAEKQRVRDLKRRQIFNAKSLRNHQFAPVAVAANADDGAAAAVVTAGSPGTVPILKPKKRHRSFGLCLITDERRSGDKRRSKRNKRPKPSASGPNQLSIAKAAPATVTLARTTGCHVAADRPTCPAKRARLNPPSPPVASVQKTMHLTATHRATNDSPDQQQQHHHHTSSGSHLHHRRPHPHHEQPSQPKLNSRAPLHGSMDETSTQTAQQRLNGSNNMNHNSHSSSNGHGVGGGSGHSLTNGTGSKSQHHHLHHQNSLQHASSNSSSSTANHSAYHQPQHGHAALMQPPPLPPPLAAAPPLPPGKHIAAASMATLGNIGNTCYLNSVIYTLRFAPHFLHNLHHLVEDLAQVTQRLNGAAAKAKSSSLGRNVSGLVGSNTRSWSTKDLASMGGISGGGSSGSTVAQLPQLVSDMPRTQRQIATEKLHDLFSALHRNEVADSPDAFHAGTFLGAVQDVSAIFEGNQQQDAHEFLMCVLDSIRETCQALTKVIGECPEIIMNGYVNVPEKVEPLPVVQNTPSVRLPFFRKRKEDKSKAQRLDSPSKESAAAAAAAAASVSAAASAAATDAATAAMKSTTLNCADSAIDAVDGSNASKDPKVKLRERIRELGLDFFTEDFEGVTVSSTKCLSCETVTEQKETMIDLSVPITGYENQDKLADQFIQDLCITREHFNSENKYRCEVCTGLTEAIRTVSYPVLPRLLIIQLKRFSGGMEKINSFIPTPFIMQCFCSRCCALPDGAKLHVYRLYSVITHVGATLSVGHYIAYTSALDGYGDQYACPKVKRKTAQQLLAQQQQHLNGGGNAKSAHGSMADGRAGMPPVVPTTAAPAPIEKNTGLIKKMIFGRSKASSSGDVTKQMKNALNGNSGSGGGSLKHHSLTNGGGGSNGSGLNGIGKDASDRNALANQPCTSLTCCGIHTKPIVSGSGTTNGHAHSNGLPDGIGGVSGSGSKSSSLYSSNSVTSDYYSASSTNVSATPTSVGQPNGSIAPDAMYTSTGTLASSSSSSANTSTAATAGGANHQMTGSTSSNPSSSLTGASATLTGSVATPATCNGNGNGSNGNINGHSASRAPPPPAPDTTWYMCDDDKIKAMSQREFEELLSPNSKKIMITPYLLFYARSNLQPL